MICDLELVPFSLRGAWFGLSRLPAARATKLGKAPALYVRTYRGKVQRLSLAHRHGLHVGRSVFNRRRARGRSVLAYMLGDGSRSILETRRQIVHSLRSLSAPA